MKSGQSPSPDATKKPGRGHNRRGVPATEKQKAALSKGTKKAAAGRKKRKEERAAIEEPPRWKQVEDGTLAIRELTDEELIRGECANNDGSWEGRRHVLPPRIQQQMSNEWKRRYRNRLDKMAPLALDAIEERLEDNEAPAQQFAAARMITEYQIGKVPDIVHLGAETEYDRLSQKAFVVLRGTEHVTVEDEDGALDNTGHQVVSGQLEEGAS